MNSAAVEGICEILPAVFQLVKDHQYEQARERIRTATLGLRLADHKGRADQIAVLNRAIARLADQRRSILETLEGSASLTEAEQEQIGRRLSEPLDQAIQAFREAKKRMAKPGIRARPD